MSFLSFFGFLPSKASLPSSQFCICIAKLSQGLVTYMLKHLKPVRFLTMCWLICVRDERIQTQGHFQACPTLTFSWAFLGPLPPPHDVHTSSSQQVSVGSLGPPRSLSCTCTTSHQFTVCEDLSSILSLSHLPEVSTKSMASLSVYHFCQTDLQLQVCRARDTPAPTPLPPVTCHKHLHFPKQSSKSTEPSREQQWSCWFLQPALPWLNNLAHRAEEGKRQ